TMKDYANEAQQIHTLIQQYKHSPGTSLLDIACGTGGHLPYLRQHYSVEGLDLDEQMLAIARQRNPGVIFHHADMVDFSLEQQFDVILCLFSSIGSWWRVRHLAGTQSTSPKRGASSTRTRPPHPPHPAPCPYRIPGVPIPPFGWQNSSGKKHT